MNTLSGLKEWARRVKHDVLTLWFALQHPDTPRWIRWLCILVVGYALSPIDLIPDFIPVLGYLDDVLLLPALIWVVMRALPSGIVERSKAKAAVSSAEKARLPASKVAAVVIISVWLAAGALFVFLLV